jgi:small-conductance mechanosensitive channel
MVALAFVATAAAAQAPVGPGPQPQSQTAQPQAPASQGQPATASPNPASATPEARAISTALETARAELDQQEAALRRPTLSDDELQALRQRIDPIGERLRQIVAEIGPKVDAAKARLDQLGPKPKDTPEGPEVARDRAEREAAVTALDENQRLARTLLLQSEQLTTQISDRRRSAFTGALFARSYGLLSPDLWSGTVSAFPRDLRALRVVAQDWWDRLEGRSSPGTLTLVGLALGIALALHIARRHLAPRIVRRDPRRVEVSRRRCLLAALGVLCVEALPAAAGSFIVYQALSLTDVMPPRLTPAVAALLVGIAFVAFVRGLIDALMAPERPTWRILAISDKAAARSRNFLIAYAITLMIGRVLDALNQAIAASLPLSIASRALVASVAALLLAEMLRRFGDNPAEESEPGLGPYVPTDAQVSGPARLAGWTFVTVVLGSVLGGYVAFASFLIHQAAWIGVVAGLFYLAIKLSDEFVGETLQHQTRVAMALQANLGLRRQSLRQIGVLAAGSARVMLFVAAVMLALAPWGIESSDIASNVSAAFFGFKVGEVTISLSTVFVAILIFGVIIAATRLVQGWLDTTFLPVTELDAGLRNSIKTAFGYVGFFIAAAIAFAYLGFGLDKIAIVAGALSVGIGFGLQSIVNNFVSGLILLVERPIRVGDLVVVGDGEGYVRKISVRATEIETFDRSTVIVPNSNLISGTVKNRVRGDRTGRIVIPVNVLRNQDPVRAAQILSDLAEKHPDVLAQPEPRVLFKKIGDTWLEFDLVAYVEDVTQQVRVQSELTFAVFKALVDEKLLPPLGPGAFSIEGLAQVQAALQHIADAIARQEPEQKEAGASTASEPPATPAPTPKRRRAETPVS